MGRSAGTAAAPEGLRPARGWAPPEGLPPESRWVSGDWAEDSKGEGGGSSSGEGLAYDGQSHSA